MTLPGNVRLAADHCQSAKSSPEGDVLGDWYTPQAAIEGRRQMRLSVPTMAPPDGLDQLFSLHYERGCDDRGQSEERLVGDSLWYLDYYAPSPYETSLPTAGNFVHIARQPLGLAADRDELDNYFWQARLVGYVGAELVVSTYGGRRIGTISDIEIEAEAIVFAASMRRHLRLAESGQDH